MMCAHSAQIFIFAKYHLWKTVDWFIGLMILFFWQKKKIDVGVIRFNPQLRVSANSKS